MNDAPTPKELELAGQQRLALTEYEQQQWNIGARIADDCFCRGCGARGHLNTCPTCERC